MIFKPTTGILVVSLVSLAVDKILDKDAKVQEQRHESTGNPAEVDEHVFAVDTARLTRRTRPFAMGFIGDNG